MLLVYLCVILCLRLVSADLSAATARRELDSLLQDYAFRALVRPRTGAVYDGVPPSNLTGVSVAALRLRSGSLWRRGVTGYKEFRIPVGVVVQPYVERLVFVYQNLGNWSSLYYSLPGYTFLTPVLGLLAYDAADLSARNLLGIGIQASGDPIAVEFHDLHLKPNVSSTRCTYFGLDGSVGFSQVVNGTICLTKSLGHFSIVVESVAVPPPAAPGGGGGHGGRNRRVWIIVGSVIGGVVLLVLLALAFAYLVLCRRRKEIRRMEEAAEVGVSLPMTTIGFTKAPVALQTRTRPMIESEFLSLHSLCLQKNCVFLVVSLCGFHSI